MSVAVAVGTAVFVSVAVGVAVFVGVAVGIAVFVGVAVGTDVFVGVAVGTDVFVGVAVGTDVFVAVGVGIAVFVAVAVGPAASTDVFMSETISGALSPRLYTRTSSITPLKYSPQMLLPPMLSWSLDVNSVPLAAALFTCTPLMYTFTVEPSNVVATCVQVFVASFAVPRASQSPVVFTTADVRAVRVRVGVHRVREQVAPRPVRVSACSPTPSSRAFANR